LNDPEALKNEQDRYKEIPEVRKLDNAIVQKNFLQIEQDVYRADTQKEASLILRRPLFKYC